MDIWYFESRRRWEKVGMGEIEKNKDVSTKTLNDLCRILECNISDIVQYVPSDTDQAL